MALSTLWLALAISPMEISHAPPPLKSIEAVIQASTREQKAKAYRDLLAPLDPEQLGDLAKGDDMGLAFQASWELSRKVIKRPKGIAGRTELVYDRDQLSKVVDRIKIRTKSSIPKWWREAITDIDVTPGDKHALFGYVTSRPVKTSKADFGCLLLNESKLQTRAEKTGIFSSSKDRSLSFDMEELGVSRDGGLSGVIGDKYSALTPYSTAGATEYRIIGYDNDKGRSIWSNVVWATGRSLVLGDSYHRVEVVTDDLTFFVFGAESHGAYLEAFDAKSGKSVFRFCTSYWSNYSEQWKK